MSDPTPPYTAEQLSSDAVGKKDLVKVLQDLATNQFLQDHKLRGQVKNVVKTKTKESLIADYNEMFETKAFRPVGEEMQAAPTKADVDHVTKETEKMKLEGSGDAEGPEKPKTATFVKSVLKKGDKTNFPRKGDQVAVLYTGKLQDGTVFDSNTIGVKRGKKPIPLRFRVGSGQVIKGWDDALLTFSTGEKAELTIPAAFAYGKKGLEGKIPSNSTLIFEVELLNIE